MTERPGDIPMEELVNSGQVELSDFFPDESEKARDMVTVLAQSPLRQSLYFGRRLRPAHTETRYDGEQKPVEFPNHVVTRPIVVQEGGEELRWNYQTKQSPNGVHLRRVFALRNQALELDVENTLMYLSATEIPEVKSQLETEANDLVNEMILQVMKDRLDGGDSMLPGSPYEPLK
ncbi:hypothetical protein HY484_02950 [Candidatus Woesearchaeota archaeon]|nr:hypothetical protein [Candidatus Woesearchaeota archaeon]